MGMTPYTTQPIAKITISRVGKEQQKIAGQRSDKGEEYRIQNSEFRSFGAPRLFMQTANE
jgi:hypothetical protein